MLGSKVASSVANVIVNALAVCGVAITIAAIVALCSGVRPVIFISGSMSPTIGTGALALTIPVEAEEIRRGDIISVTRDDGMRVTHRAVELVEDAGRQILTMQGDANSAVDVDRYDVTDGADRVIWHVEGVGAVIGSLRSPWIIVGAVALVVIALLPGKRRAGRPVVATGSGHEAAGS